MIRGTSMLVLFLYCISKMQRKQGTGHASLPCAFAKYGEKFALVRRLLFSLLQFKGYKKCERNKYVEESLDKRCIDNNAVILPAVMSEFFWQRCKCCCQTSEMLTDRTISVKTLIHLCRCFIHPRHCIPQQLFQCAAKRQASPSLWLFLRCLR